jgi:hypothetical protein
LLAASFAATPGSALSGLLIHHYSGLAECTGSCSDLLHRIRNPFINVKPLRVNRHALHALSTLLIADKKQQRFSPVRALRNHRIATGSKG